MSATGEGYIVAKPKPGSNALWEVSARFVYETPQAARVAVAILRSDAVHEGGQPDEYRVLRVTPIEEGEPS